MRLFELLLETPQEDKALIQLAKLINSSLPAPKGSKALKLGSVQQFVNELPSAMKSVLGDRLSNVGLELQSPKAIAKHANSGNTNSKSDTEGRTTSGYWLPDDDIGVKTSTPTGTVVANKELVGTTELVSLLSHEFRHALDDSKSEYGAADSKRYNRPRKKEHQNDEYGYVAQPAEINARFVQAMESLSRAIPVIYKLPPDKIKARIKMAINQSFQNNNISDLFPEKDKSRDYKQLIKRAVRFAEGEMAEFEKTLTDQGRPKQATGNW